MNTPTRSGTTPSIAIVGAGLSGLCLAQALLQAGLDVRIYERDATPFARRQGYRLTIDQEGAAALKACLPPHLFEAVRATASSHGDVGYFRFTNNQLGEIFSLTFAHEDRAVDPRPLGQVDRATVRTILLSGLEDRVQFGRAATRIETTPEGATIQFAHGDATRASVVVGADGIHSALRPRLLPACPVRDTGLRGIYGKTSLWRDGQSLVPRSLENSGVWAMGDAPGRGFFFTSMRFNDDPRAVFARLVPDQRPPITDDYVMWAVMLPREELPTNLGDLEAEALHRLALDAARTYHPVLRRFVEHADTGYTVATTFSAATRPTTWPASRATLMGDAVHVMPPTGAHGGNTALRDAAVLAQHLQEAMHRGEPLEHAIASYQNTMLEYAFAEVTRSTTMLKRGAIANPLLRFAMLRAVPWLRSLRGGPLVRN